MTFNIRYDNPGDSANAWIFRKNQVAQQVIANQVNLLGIQEALAGQVSDLRKSLPGFGFTGAGRDDGKSGGEHCAFLFDTSRLALTSSGHFWLSPTPYDPGSKGWDAAITRMVNWALFMDKINGKQFAAFNTHFDHIGKEARRQSSLLLLKQVKKRSGKRPALVMGDFNATPAEEPVRLLTDQGNPDHLVNSLELSETSHEGPMGTFNGFQSTATGDQPIDFIFLKGKWRVLRHATIDQSQDGRFASDHFAVTADIMYP